LELAIERNYPEIIKAINEALEVRREKAAAALQAEADKEKARRDRTLEKQACLRSKAPRLGLKKGLQP
jgi:regulator of protease activity HflC (stomatin/prohibitin superfamily)